MRRLLLDTSDLINVLEHKRPITPDALENRLISRDAALVLTFTTVLEFVAPVVSTGDFLYFRPLLQRLEHMPILFLSNGHVPMQELKHAAEVFVGQAEYSSIDPYVQRWDETVQLPGESLLKQVVGLRIDEAVHMIWKSNPAAISGHVKHTGALRKVVKEDRSRRPAARVSQEENFPNTIRKHLQRSQIYGFVMPENRTEPFANWIYSDPRRCPGLRLSYDLYHSKLANIGDQPKSGDISDQSLAQCLPYVDAISVDRRTGAYLRDVCQRLETRNPALGYSAKIRSGLKEMLLKDL
jgi:hypothetical protein